MNHGIEPHPTTPDDSHKLTAQPVNQLFVIPQIDSGTVSKFVLVGQLFYL